MDVTWAEVKEALSVLMEQLAARHKTATEELSAELKDLGRELSAELKDLRRELSAINCRLDRLEPHLAGTPLQLTDGLYIGASAVLIQHLGKVFVATCAHCVVVNVTGKPGLFKLRDMTIEKGPAGLKGESLSQLCESVQIDVRYDCSDLDAALFVLKEAKANMVRHLALPLHEAQIELGEHVSCIGYTPLGSTVQRAHEVLVYGRVCLCEGEVANIASQSRPGLQFLSIGLSGAGAVVLHNRLPSVAGILLGTRSLGVPLKFSTIKLDVSTLGSAFGMAIANEAQAPHYVAILSSKQLRTIAEDPSCTHLLTETLSMLQLDERRLTEMREENVSLETTGTIERRRIIAI
eukprot:TRINITY_DN2635_c0_g2_i1.p2 TRINITY_DN2635_c0_g2~~TRINITY_DN2635_c0_g2_i1.p2  ORF type:complete len:350 (+),score=53.50 TRINITY_DN2635_c0_g2_i1:1827-2876(+)